MSSEHSCTLHIKQSNFQGKLGELDLLPGMFPRSQSPFLSGTLPALALGPSPLPASHPSPTAATPVGLHRAQDGEDTGPWPGELLSSPLSVSDIPSPYPTSQETYNRRRVLASTSSQETWLKDHKTSAISTPTLQAQGCLLDPSGMSGDTDSLCLITKLRHCTVEIIFALNESKLSTQGL